MTERSGDAIEVDALSISGGDDREYERVVVADGSLAGPRGKIEFERRYEGLPRHNDVVAPETVETNDDMLDDADAVHVHTKWFAGDEYLGDAHATWEPDDPAAVLADDASFAAACREHVRRTAARTYAAGFER